MQKLARAPLPSDHRAISRRLRTSAMTDGVAGNSCAAALQHRQVPHEEVSLCPTHSIEDRARVGEEPEMPSISRSSFGPARRS
jgi:hypothetical protein